MKKLLVVVFGCLMLFLASSVLACENCDCGCKNGEKCNCKKECVKDCDCACHKGEKCKNEDCKCTCHKDCKCDENCKCGCNKKSKVKKVFNKLFRRNKIKCNCEE